MPNLLRRPVRALALVASLFAVHASAAHADVAFTRSDVAGVSDVTAVALGDLDGKNGPDLVTMSNDGLQVRLNNGDGTFGAPSTISTSTSDAHGTSSCVPYQIEIADVVGGTANLGGDGKADLAIACYSGVYQGTTAGGVLARIPGNGDGTFGPIIVSPTGTSSSPQFGETRFALAEWRENGPPYVVFPGEGYDSHLGHDVHTFCWSDDWVNASCSSSRMAYGPLVAGEVDGADFDEVLTMSDTGDLQSFGIDTGSVGPPREQSWGTLATGDGTRWSSALIGDIQRDGRPDVVTTSGTVSAGTVNVILGVDGGLGYAVDSFPSAPGLVGGALIDADGDGLPDFVGSTYTGHVFVQRTTPAGTLSAPQFVADSGFPGDPNSSISPSAAADLDGNGTTDFVVADPGASTIEVLLNGALGTVAPTGTTPPVTGGTPTGTVTPTAPGTGTAPIPGAPTPTPPAAPVPAKAKLVISNLRVKGRTLSVEVNLPATVHFQVQTCKTRRVGGKKKTTCKTTTKLTGTVAAAGRISIKLPDKVEQGTYLVTATATGATAVHNNLVVAKK